MKIEETSTISKTLQEKWRSPQYMRNTRDGNQRLTFFLATTTAETAVELTQNFIHINSLNSQNDSIR